MFRNLEILNNNGCWEHESDWNNLKAGMIFRVFEPDGTAVTNFNQDCTKFLAVSDAEEIEGSGGNFKIAFDMVID